jgi:hypothetical protein
MQANAMNDEVRAFKPSNCPNHRLLVNNPWILCTISRAHWCRLEVSGKTPVAIRLGRKKLYRQRDIEWWVEWGCPARNEFEARLAQEDRRRGW